MNFQQRRHHLPDNSARASHPQLHLASSNLTIADMSEVDLTKRINALCTGGVARDEVALIDLQTNHQLVVTNTIVTKQMNVSGETTSPYSMGWRTAATNLADIAAMGAAPIGLTVGLGLPGQTLWTWVEAFYHGLADCLNVYDGVTLSSVLCRAMQCIISITGLGQVCPHQLISRYRTIPGMTVIVTGPHGASHAGLALLKATPEFTAESTSGQPIGQAQAWIRAYQRPVPRFDAIACLRQLIGQSEHDPYPTITGMSSRKGLANTLLQLSAQSKVGMEIVRSRIPLPPGLSAAVGGKTALEWALHGTEDLELVLCLPPNLAEAFTQTPFATAIGTTTDTGTVTFIPTEHHTTGTQFTQDL